MGTGPVSGFVKVCVLQGWKCEDALLTCDPKEPEDVTCSVTGTAKGNLPHQCPKGARSSSVLSNGSPGPEGPRAGQAVWGSFELEGP